MLFLAKSPGGGLSIATGRASSQPGAFFFLSRVCFVLEPLSIYFKNLCVFGVLSGLQRSTSESRAQSTHARALNDPVLMRPTQGVIKKNREPSGLGVQSRAPLAQSVEYWSYEPMVTGSSPVWSIFFFCSLPPHPLRHHIAGPIAQLVERWSNKPLVVGSIPTGTTLLFSCFLVQRTRTTHLFFFLWS